MLEGRGVATGVDMNKARGGDEYDQKVIGRPPVSRVASAAECEEGGAGERDQRARDLRLPSLRRPLTPPIRAHHDVGQPGRDLREEADQHHRQQHQPDERQHAPDHVARAGCRARCS